MNSGISPEILAFILIIVAIVSVVIGVRSSRKPPSAPRGDSGTFEYATPVRDLKDSPVKGASGESEVAPEPPEREKSRVVLGDTGGRKAGARARKVPLTPETAEFKQLLVWTELNRRSCGRCGADIHVGDSTCPACGEAN